MKGSQRRRSSQRRECRGLRRRHAGGVRLAWKLGFVGIGGRRVGRCCARDLEVVVEN